MRHRYTKIITKFAIFTAAIIFAITAGNAVSAQMMPPSNDMFANAEEITGLTGYADGTTFYASSEPDEPMYFKGGQTVWYRWTPTSPVSITFDLKGREIGSSGIAIYHGTYLTKLATMGYGTRFDRVTFIAQPKVEYMIQVCSKTDNATEMFELSWAINGAETWKQFNFDGPQATYTGPPSGKSDFAIIRYAGLPQEQSQWWIWRSNLQIPITYSFGDHLIKVEHLVPGDFDGDGLADIALYHKQTSIFWIMNSRTNTVMAQAWGLSEDNPVQGDFDGDDIADIAIFRPSTGTFWILRSSDGQPFAMQWGMTGDDPVVGDYDGDGITDFAIKRGSGSDHAIFYLLRSSDQQMEIFNFGFGHDMTVPGDYDGDGKNDLAVFRPSNTTFYFLASSTREVNSVTLDIGKPFENGDHAVPGDYYGDARSDMCIWMFRTANFACFPDGQPGYLENFHFGLPGDEPVAFSNVHE